MKNKIQVNSPILFDVIVHVSRMNYISNKQQDLDHGMANGDENPRSGITSLILIRSSVS